MGNYFMTTSALFHSCTITLTYVGRVYYSKCSRWPHPPIHISLSCHRGKMKTTHALHVHSVSHLQIYSGRRLGQIYNLIVLFRITSHTHTLCSNLMNVSCTSLVWRGSQRRHNHKPKE